MIGIKRLSTLNESIPAIMAETLRRAGINPVCYTQAGELLYNLPSGGGIGDDPNLLTCAAAPTLPTPNGKGV
jgi:hypothetical protein